VLCSVFLPCLGIIAIAYLFAWMFDKGNEL
jgi:hypothetical protein